MNRVIYHDNCKDGFCSAFLAWESLVNMENDLSVKTVFQPSNYGEKIEFGQNERIFFLDFSTDPDTLLEMCKENEVIIIDHHIGFKDKLVEKLGPESHKYPFLYVFNNEKSGARLTSEYFFPHSKVPKIAEYTEDQDLWNWHLPYSRQINIVMSMLPNEFKAWHSFSLKLEDEFGFKDIAGQGNLLLSQKGQIIDQLLKSGYESLVKFKNDEYNVFFIPASVFQSDVCSEALRHNSKIDLACAFVWGHKDVRLSFRSRKGSEVDCNKIAGLFGGGGHNSAAGARVRHAVFLSQILGL